MFIKVKSAEDGGKFSVVNTDFVQHVTGDQIQMADGSIFYMPNLKEEADKEKTKEEKAFMEYLDPHLKALTDIRDAIANIKLTYGGTV